MLRGTIREHGYGKRRAFMRFFACEEDLSNERHGRGAAGGTWLAGAKPLLIIGAIAGGMKAAMA